MLNRILALNPWIEVAIRTAYWRIPAVHALLSKIHDRGNGAVPAEPVPDALPYIIEAIRAFGVTPGDILIVHSDLNLLRRLGLRLRRPRRSPRSPWRCREMSSLLRTMSSIRSARCAC